MTFQTLLRLARAWFGLPTLRTPTGHVFPTHIEVDPRPVYDAFTRVYNFTGALLGIIILSPLLLTIAVAVKLTSAGPAFYRGARVGQGEGTFSIFKFRTMHVGAEGQIGKRLVKQDENHYTPVGKFLRRYRLDELAQLFNVLRGDMNLVGPRPVRPIFLADHKARIPGYARRFVVRPGITGQAQVRGGYYTHPRHKLFYEMLYIARRSVVLDLQLIALTFLRVMTRIFTTAFLLAWLLLMALVLPGSMQESFFFSLGSVNVNALYLVPTLIAVSHLVRHEVQDGRIYALRTPVDLPLLGFIVVSAGLVLFSRFPMISLRGVLWYVCNGVVVFYMVLNSRMITDHRGTLIGALVGAVTLVGVGALGQMALAAAATGEFARLAGTAGNPLALAAVVVVALPLAIERARRARTRRRRLLYGAASALLCVVALLTLSRSGIVATALTMGIYVWRLRKRFVLAVVAALALAVGTLGQLGDPRLAPSNAVNDLQASATRQGLVLQNITPARLMVGVGARTYPQHVTIGQRHNTAHSDEARRQSPLLDNAYLSLFVDHGPLGLAFFLAFLVGGLVFMFRSVPLLTDEEARCDLWATASGLVGCAVLIGFWDAFYRFPMMIVFFATMGLGVGLAVRYRRGPRQVYRLVHYRHHL